jgi:hypothetical protein
VRIAKDVALAWMPSRGATMAEEASAQDADICQLQEADFAITGTRHEL